MLHWYSKVTIILRKSGKETIIVRRREYDRNIVFTLLIFCITGHSDAMLCHLTKWSSRL